MTIQEMARALRARQCSATELTRTTLDRIEKLNPSLCAFITVMHETARAQAQQAEAELAKGIDRGLLHGIPVAVKDLFFTQGVHTT